MNTMQEDDFIQDEINDYIIQGQDIASIDYYYDWFASIAAWIDRTFTDKGYAAEWLALTDGPPSLYWTGNDQIIKEAVDDAVSTRIGWLNKLGKVTAPTQDALNEVSLLPNSELILRGVNLFKTESVVTADDSLTSWIRSVNSWLEECHLGSDFLKKWNTIGNSPFKINKGELLDTKENWILYKQIICSRYQWLAELISKSNTVEKQFRRLDEVDQSARRQKFNFDGPGYDLIELLKSELKKTGGYTKYSLFADDESIFEYAAFKFLVRGKELTIKQLKKSVENKKNL